MTTPDKFIVVIDQGSHSNKTRAWVAKRHPDGTYYIHATHAFQSQAVAHAKSLNEIHTNGSHPAQPSDMSSAIDCNEGHQKLSAFFREGMSIAFEGGDWCGADIQDKAEELGLIRSEPYDPEKHAEHGSFEGERGDPFYLINQELVAPAINCKTE